MKTLKLAKKVCRPEIQCIVCICIHCMPNLHCLYGITVQYGTALKYRTYCSTTLSQLKIYTHNKYSLNEILLCFKSNFVFISHCAIVFFLMKIILHLDTLNLR